MGNKFHPVPQPSSSTRERPIGCGRRPNKAATLARRSGWLCGVGWPGENASWWVRAAAIRVDMLVIDGSGAPLENSLSLPNWG
jgi:hypothetical protein